MKVMSGHESNFDEILDEAIGIVADTASFVCQKSERRIENGNHLCSDKRTVVLGGYPFWCSNANRRSVQGY